MNLQGRNLSFGMQGDDVELLHRGLGHLGYTIERWELASRTFGEATRRAVLEFQERQSSGRSPLPVTGEVDEATALRIGAALQAPARPPDGDGRAIDPQPDAEADWDLRGPDGEIGASGDEVRRLHGALARLGLSVPDAERAGALFGDGTREAVIRFQQEHGLEPTGVVDALTAREITAQNDRRRPRFVRGHVRVPDGDPLVGIRVRAFDANLRAERSLGEALTDANGQYEITYTAPQLGREGKERADLVVRAYFENEQEPLISSEIVFNAELAETVDLMTDAQGRAPSEYERLRSQIETVLEGVPPEALTPDQVAYLSGSTGVDRQQVGWLVESAARPGDGSARRAVLRAVPDGPANRVAATPGPGPRRARPCPGHSAAQQPHPGPAARGARPDPRPTIACIAGRGAARPAREGAPASLGDLLGATFNDEGKQREFAALLAGRRDATKALREAEGQTRVASATDIRRLQVTLELSELTGNYLPLVRELLHRGERDSAFREPREFAAYDHRDWREVVQATGTPVDVSGATPEARLDAYADGLERAFEARFPTAVIANRIERGTFTVDDGVRPALVRFFGQNPDFELGQQYVGAFLAEGGGANLGGIDRGELPKVTEELSKLERVDKIVPRSSEANAGPRYRAFSTLLDTGFDSAHKIVRLGRRDFTADVGSRLPGGRASAARLYEQAERNAAQAQALLAKYSQAFNPFDLPVLQGAGTTEPIPAPDSSSGIPDLRTLFGSLDFCACEHCRSVYGPAAYLVDLLKFLADRKLPDGRSLKDVLFAPTRRPDIGETQLTCENTSTPMPYVDLVNEVLENAVSPRDTNARYPQTSWTADELAANPEHLHAKAYEKLEGSPLPLEPAVQPVDRGGPDVPRAPRGPSLGADGDLADPPGA